MLRNYIKIALRTLQKQKLLALINVLGLSISIACATLVLLYAGNELSFDRFHKNAHRIFRVYETVKGPGSEDPTFMTNLPMPLGPELVRSFPEIKEFSRLFFEQDEKLVRSKGQIHRVNISFADPQFFSIFSFPLRYGNSYSALSDPENVVLTSSIAKSLFGTENALGQEFEIKIDSSFQTFRVGAVLEDLPANSSIRFDLLASMPIQERTNSGKTAMTDWFRSEYQTYILVDPNTNLQNLEKKLNKFQGAFTEEDQIKLKKSGFIPTYGLQALRSMHTDTKIKDGTTVERSTIWIMISVAAGILIIACINFTTLAIGRSAGRSKEVGIRKVAGAKRKQLVLQFLAEAFLLTILSTFIGIVIANFLLPYFNELSGRELQFSFSNYPELPWLLAGLLIIVGLVAGSYPAILLSGFNPVEVFKSRVRVGGSNWFTQSLVTIQFTISVGLMMSTLVLLKQARYMSEKDLGFKKENVLMIDASETDTKKIYPLFKEEMKKLPGISGIACASEAMGNGEEFGLNVFKFKDRGAMASFNSIDPDFIEVMGMKLIAGRNFRANIPQDSLLSVIINESLAEELGWSVETAVGQPLSGFSGSHHPDPLVIGVVADFNFRPLTEKVTPQLFCPFCNDDRSKFLLRLQAGNPTATISEIEKTWKALAPGIPIRYSFIDEKIDQYYKAEHRWSRIIGWAGVLSILLACLGLFGLSSLVSVNRLKEIGIRRVMGASELNIVTLISKQFIRLVSIAVIIASPIAWFIMNKWLETFAYRININWTIFLITAALTLAVSLLTVGYQAFKAAVSNPVKSLRTE